MTILLITKSKTISDAIEQIAQESERQEVKLVDSPTRVLKALGLTEGSEAIGRADLLVVDMAIGTPESIELCRRVHDTKETSNIPIVVTTGQDRLDDLAAAFAAGAVDYISSPVNQLELRTRLHTALLLKEEMDTRRARELELLEVTRKLAKANRILRRLSFIDGLTGVPNRRYFDEFLQKEWRRAARMKHPIALIMMDIDFFKQYNDIYGHQEGDDCLKRVGEILNRHVRRPGDHVARYGGEEFAVILTEQVTMEGALLVAEKLRARISALGIEHEGSEVADHVTISLGICVTSPERMTTPEKLLVSADEALYHAKGEGRDRTHVVQMDETT